MFNLFIGFLHEQFGRFFWGSFFRFDIFAGFVPKTNITYTGVASEDLIEDFIDFVFGLKFLNLRLHFSFSIFKFNKK
jgi:hypothetical protein